MNHIGGDTVKEVIVGNDGWIEGILRVVCKPIAMELSGIYEGDPREAQ